MAISTTGKDNLLTLMQRVCGELGLVRPSVVVGSTDLQLVQLFSLMRREAREQFSMGTPIGGWQQLRMEYLFNVQSTGLLANCSTTSGSNIITLASAPATAPQVGWVLSNSGGSNATGFVYPTTVTAVIDSTHLQMSTAATVTATGVSMAFGKDTYPMPADYDHLIPQTQWDRGFRWQLLGPMSPQEWQVLKSGISPTGPRRRYRLIGGNFVVDPVPYDTNQLVFEYYSSSWAQSSTGAAQSNFLADTDYFVLDDDALVLGTIWRFRRAKGLDYDEEKSMWQDRIALVIGRNAGQRNMPLNASQGGPRFLNSQNVPDTGFGS